MGVREDLKRFRNIGKKYRQDLKDYIKKGDLAGRDKASIPIKKVDLPEFKYSKPGRGGVGDAGEGKPKPGKPAGKPKDKDGEGDEAGEESGKHGQYEMDPEEFAEELEKELGLPEMEPKGKKVKELKKGAYKNVSRSGPRSTLNEEKLFKEGFKRKLATFYDKDYVREALKVEGENTVSVYRWLRSEKNVNVSKKDVDRISEYIEEPEKYGSFEEMDNENEMMDRKEVVRLSARNPEIRDKDKEYRHPEIIEEYEENAVIVNIRDCSGSMREKKRGLVERLFTPMDWYLEGKYENAEFVYIVHDSDAYQVGKQNFFGITSGGGTKVSRAYKLAKEILEDNYPWREWNRYIFAAGDGENWQDDTREEMVPLMEDLDVNYHAYAQVEPGPRSGDLADVVEDEYSDDNLAVVKIRNRAEVIDAIYDVLSTEGGDE